MQTPETVAAATTTTAAEPVTALAPEQRALLEKLQKEEKRARRMGFVKGFFKGVAVVGAGALAGAGLAYAYNRYSEQ